MAVSMIKTTYALDVPTVRALDELARRWGVSKSEALRRSIRAATEGAPTEASQASLAALDRLQRAWGLGPAEAARWARSARAERTASSRRREARQR